MRRTALLNGLAAGLLLSTMFMITLYIGETSNNPSLASTIGNILLMASLSMIFFAIRNVRDRLNGGSISFNQAFRTSMVVVLVATGCYTITKNTYALVINPNYIEKSINETIKVESDMIRSDKEISEEEKTKRIKAFESNMNDLKSPASFFLSSILDFFPMGFAIALLCSALMHRTKVEKDIEFKNEIQTEQVP
jgi:hypothetical protein